MWRVSLFELHRLPCELAGLAPTFVDWRIANILLDERDKFKNDVCKTCLDYAKDSTKECPICGAKWVGSMYECTYVGRRKLDEESERRRRFFKLGG